MAPAFRLIVALSLTGCLGMDWDDVPGARVRPVNLDPSVPDAVWADAVLGAVDEWDAALEALGCPAPFSRDLATSGAHPVELVPMELWPSDEMGSDGLTYGDGPGMPPGGIHIRVDADARDQWRSVLLHEMGHAIGLPHVPEEPPSVMCENAGCSSRNLTSADIAAAACVLGCGAC